MPVYLVLGANGFIGSHVANALRTLPGASVVGGGLGTPTAGMEDHWIGVDLLESDETELANAVAKVGPGVVVNCTGATAGQPSELIRTNVSLAARIVAALDRAAVPARIVHLGSAAEYGRGPIGVPVTEAREPEPLSDYGRAKLAATRVVLDAGRAGREAIVLRVFNPLGPGMTPGSLPGNVMRKFAEAREAGVDRIEVGPLDPVRDFVDVRDVAGAAVAASTASPLRAPIVNVGSGTGHTARELVTALAARVGFRGRIVETAPGSPRSADVPWQVASIDLARETLGWQPAYDFAATVDFVASGRV